MTYRGWDGWMASRTWVWVNSGSWRWTKKPGVLQSMGLQRVGHDWVTELNWGTLEGFPSSSDGKESACQYRRPGSVPELGRSPGEGNGNPFQYSGLENSMDKGVWQDIVHRVAESDRTERLTLSLSQELWKPFLHSQLCFLIPFRFHRTKSCG